MTKARPTPADSPIIVTASDGSFCTLVHDPKLLELGYNGTQLYPGWYVPGPGDADNALASFSEGGLAELLAEDSTWVRMYPREATGVDMLFVGAWLMDRAHQTTGCCSVSMSNAAAEILRGAVQDAQAHGELDADLLARARRVRNEQHLVTLTALCRCCALCHGRPCGGCQQGAMCDAMPCHCHPSDIDIQF